MISLLNLGFILLLPFSKVSSRACPSEGFKLSGCRVLSFEGALGKQASGRRLH